MINGAILSFIVREKVFRVDFVENCVAVNASVNSTVRVYYKERSSIGDNNHLFLDMISSSSRKRQINFTIHSHVYTMNNN